MFILCFLRLSNFNFSLIFLSSNLIFSVILWWKFVQTPLVNVFIVFLSYNFSNIFIYVDTLQLKFYFFPLIFLTRPPLWLHIIAVLRYSFSKMSKYKKIYLLVHFSLKILTFFINYILCIFTTFHLKLVYFHVSGTHCF